MPQINLGNGFEIDVADGWTFVHTLQAALDQAQASWQADGNELVIPAPGNDGHSGTFSTSMTHEATQKLTDWYTGQVQRLNTMIETATGILQQYGITETANTIQWGTVNNGSTGTNPDGGKGDGRGAS